MEFSLSNGSGLTVKVLDYGGAVVEILCPDREGRIENVTMGLNGPEDYESNPFWAGVICGPVAGRIQGAAFSLDGQEHSLSENEPGSCLHGGFSGFSRRLYDWEILEESGVKLLRLSTKFDDGEEGFPGPISFEADYIVRPGGIFEFRWRGRSKRSTLLAPALHLYLNLSGFSASGLDQLISIDSDQVMLNPAKPGEERLASVEGTRFDLRVPSPIRAGYDNPFKLNHRGPLPDVTLRDPKSGRNLSVYTSEPWVVLYDGSGLKPTPYRAIALEPQGWGNGINSGIMAPPVLRPGEILSGRTVYLFGSD